MPDAACRRTLVGEETLRGIEAELKQVGKKVRYFGEKNVFKFGNNECLESRVSVLIPVQFGGRSVVIKAAVLPGKGAVTPLLLSKEFLRQLGTHMDLSSSMIAFERLGVCLRMGVTSRGHFAVPLFDDHAHEQHSHTRTHKCTEAVEESFHAEKSEEKDTAASSQVPSVPGPVTCYSRETDHGGQSQELVKPGADECDQGQEELGGGREESGVAGVSRPTTRSAKRRARRRRAAGRHQVHDWQVQGKGVPRRLCGQQELHGVDPSERVSSSDQVQCEHAGVSPVCGSEGQGQAESHRKDQGEEQAQDGREEAGNSPLSFRGKLGRDHGRADSGREEDDGGARGSGDPKQARADEEVASRVGRGARDSVEPDVENSSESADHAEGQVARMSKAERRHVKKSLDDLIHDRGAVVDVLTVCDQSVHDQDIMEVFSTPHITATAQKMSLKADYAFDVKLGCDLRSPEARKKVMETVITRRPKLVVICPPCGPFSVLQRLRKVRGEAYEKALSEAKELLDFAMEVCTEQHNAGRKFVFEHPWLADLGFKDACRKC